MLVPGGRFLLIDNTAPEILEYDQFYNHVEKRETPAIIVPGKSQSGFSFLKRRDSHLNRCTPLKRILLSTAGAKRMQLASKDKEELENDMLSPSERVKEYFMIKEKEGHVQAFTGDAVFIKARK